MNPNYRFGTMVVAIAAATPAVAGDEVLFGQTPDWVIEAPLDEAIAADEEFVLYDKQVRLENGVVTRYTDLAYQIATAQSLQRYGTIQLTWLPDKGDSTIHRLEIVRGEEIIDLVAQGLKPDVIRREKQLEQRSVDGMLTAVLAIPGLQIGDVLRFTSSITMRDQALNGEMQVTEGVIAKPGRVGFGRVRIIWPEDQFMHWGKLGQIELPELVTANGYQSLEVSLPIAKPEKMPDDAPHRFTTNPLIQVGTFADWSAVSKVMAPHYVTEGAIVPGGPIATEVARIEAASSDPLVRTALALRLVQDEISYLANGMNGGNYIPQSPAETWEKRYGDCKAKTMLLLAMLRAMGIDSEAVLVESDAGDAIGVSQPVPGAFDHVIVRATVDGTDYWLDGTSTGSRIDTMYEVPDFDWVLPIRPEGSSIVQLEQRWPKVPDRVVRVTYDMRNGVDFPALYDVEVEAKGTMGAKMRAAANEKDRRLIIGQAIKYLEDLIGGLVFDASYSYDEDGGIGRLVAKGMTFDSFSFEHDIASHSVSGTTTNWEFNPDRARSAWRDVPYQTGGPYTVEQDAKLLLPESVHKFEVSGIASLDEVAAGVRFSRTSELVGTTFTMSDRTSYVPMEIAPEDISKEKAAIRRIASGDPVLQIHGAKRFWELDDRQIAKRVEPYIAGVESLMDIQEDVASFYGLRGSLNYFARNFDAALEDFGQAIDQAATAELYSERADTHFAMGNVDAAVEDARRAFELQGDLATGAALATFLALSGDPAAGLDLLDSMGLSGDEGVDVDIAWAELSGMGDRQAEAWDRLENAIVGRPAEGALFNSQCWLAGTWSVNLDAAEPVCEKALQLLGYSAGAIDSRALLRYRLGRKQEALSDLNDALTKEPGQAASRYLRGIIRLEMGDKGGKEDLMHAKRISPSIIQQYDAYGIKAPN